MRILMVIPSFKPLVGGAERQLEGLAENLVGDNVSVLVVTRKLPDTSKHEHFNGFDILRLSAVIPKLSFAFALLFALIKLQNKFDIIHCHTLNGPAIICTVVGRLINKPVILKVTRSGDGSQLQTYNRNIFKRFLFRILASWSYRFIATTNDVQKALINQGVQRRRIVCIPNGVDVGKIMDRNTDGIIQIIFVGRLILRKRADWLIRAHSFLNVIKNTRLIIIGNGSEYKNLNALVTELKTNERVDFKGMLSKELVEKELANAEIFVLPSTSEGMSNAILEAMSKGLAVIATDITQNRELITDKLNGRLFKTQEDLSLILGELVSDDKERSRLGANAYELAQQKFDFSIISNSYNNLYKTIHI